MNTNRTLTNADIVTIAERILDLATQRLAAPPKVTPSPPPVAAPSKEVKAPAPAKLAYTLRELSVELGMSKVSIYRLVERGLLKPLPYLRTKIFPRQEVERFLSAGTNWSATRSRH